MGLQCDFKFAPMDLVFVTAFGLNYRGRVQWCKADGGQLMYHVQYANDRGEVCSGEYYEDELSARTA